MKGFFSGETAKDKIAAGYGTNNEHPCDVCGLWAGCNNPYMPMGGQGKLRVLAIGEGPGFNEDQQNTQFVGDSGQLLEGYLAQYGIDLHRDFNLINAVNCRPPDNRTPKPKEIACCRFLVEQAIEDAQPQFIWLLGESAIKSFYGGRFSDTDVGRWRGLCIPDPATGAWVLPMYHPSFALRSKKDGNKTSVYERDLAFAVEALKRPAPTFIDFEGMVETSTDPTRIMQVLNQCIEMCVQEEYFYMAFDFETNSLRPWGATKRILTVALALADDWCFSFPVRHSVIKDAGGQSKIIAALKRLMEDPYALKIAHNLQFEDQWAVVNLGAREVAGWDWCTMNAAHVIDCRRHFCGLKFQAYINYGVEGYDKATEKYKVNTYPGTDINMLDQVPIKELLLYGGMDAIITRHLFNDQQQELLCQPTLLDAYGFFHRGLQNLSRATITGIPTDPIYYVEQTGVLEKRIEDVERKLLRGKVAKQFKEHTGRELTIVNKDFSTVDLRIVLFDILKLKTTKETGSGLKSVDKEVLADIKNPWVEALLERRKLHKLAGTYMAQFVRGIGDDHKLHPLFPLHTARTYRGSSMDPNFQNIPKRDKEAKRITRHGIKADDGWHLGAVDYGSMEVRIAACCSQDPKLVWYCTQPGADMHQDIAERLWVLQGDNVTGDIRFHSKGGFVFAEIYGSYYVNCARYLWEECLIKEKTKEGWPLREHLKAMGVIDGADNAKAKYKIHGRLETIPRHLAQFIEHVKGVEKWFWEEFGVLREWQERLVQEYQSKGYVEMFFGFRRGGLLTNNMIFNSTIQGTAFHCLLWSFNHISEFARMWWEGQTIGEIHDEILYHMPSGEVQAVFDESERVMCHDIRERFDWIIVPLIAEPELSPPGGNWTQMHELKRNAQGLWVLPDEPPF